MIEILQNYVKHGAIEADYRYIQHAVAEVSQLL